MEISIRNHLDEIFNRQSFRCNFQSAVI